MRIKMQMWQSELKWWWMTREEYLLKERSTAYARKSEAKNQETIENDMCECVGWHVCR